MPLPLRVRLLLAALAISATAASCGASAQQNDPTPERLAASGIHHAPRADSGFENDDGPLVRGSFLKWRWNRLIHGLPPPPANGYAFPVDHPDVGWISANRSENAMTWIGHASTLLQIGGVNILTDPVFSGRASPVAFAGPKRRMPPALTPDQLPHIDVVLISHNHYDHLDTASVQALNAQPGGPPVFLVPLGIKDWLANKGITNAQELDWGDQTRAAGLDIWFVPATHWSARSLADRNETLWGGWVVKTPAGARHPYAVYFAGDTGYSDDFKRIGAAFGCFDLALIPIGGYEPRWFMGPPHVDPQQAVQIFEDVHAKKAIGIHWGTFELTDEPLDEPPQKLAEAARAANLPDDAFTVLRHGQTILLDAPAQTASDKSSHPPAKTSGNTAAAKMAATRGACTR
ncbi:MBL fold metallo-hydrolase [Paraburkholderia sp. LEh10]|uniref:MBL fold metallo-hydrolase n=1 Tax=Paraburkholderia sp. LEh10 TaxID=2821353 RepID=UPI001AE5FB92|nr:MBL fold metallo-hydrolase [Paraburkholderia sp. LEh10]MBP0590140.1 MBL fold metallo-hydrolase [Paraburkholderia sp. LEh10]